LRFNHRTIEQVRATAMGYWNNGHIDAGWGIAMMLFMLGIWALIAVAIVWFVRSTRTLTVPPAASAGDSVTSSAEQILAERLARGDIDPEEYQARLNVLSSRRAP
jgi:putative membrane protein